MSKAANGDAYGPIIECHELIQLAASDITDPFVELLWRFI